MASDAAKVSSLRARRGMGQGGPQLNAIVIRDQRCQPVNEHPHPAREMPALRIHHVERRWLGEPVRQYQIQRPTLHRLFQHEGR